MNNLTSTQKLDSFLCFKLPIETRSTSAVTYSWKDSKGVKVAEFTIWSWWNGINLGNFEIFGEYKRTGLSYEFLDYAVKKCGVRHLTVAKDNTIAKHIYDKYGFKIEDEDDLYYYMNFNK